MVETFPWWDIYTLQAHWRFREESVRECAARLACLLDALAPLHVGFRRLAVPEASSGPLGDPPIGGRALVPFFAPQRLSDAARDEGRPHGFAFGAEARLDLGRFVTLRLTAGFHAACATEADFAWVGMPNTISVSTVVNDFDGVDRAILDAQKPALRAIVDAWEPDTAAAVSYHYAARRGLAYRRAWRGYTEGAWMVYLEPQRAARVTPPPGALVDAMPGGGMLLCPTDEPFHEGDPLHRARADAMHTAIAVLGL